ncbi:MAG: hypothetical protein AB9869_04815 [Verrucomicrobiia bacterium]
MKKSIIKSIVAALLLSSSATALLAQDAATPTCPLGHAPGYGQTLTPEQRAAQRAIVQQLVTELQAKREAGTINAGELAWLAQFENRGGRCINGEPRGPRAGKGPGQGQGAGYGHQRGQRDSTGPRSVDGTCPLGNTPAKRGGR